MSMLWFYYTVLSLLLLITPPSHTASWRVFFYMDSSDKLSDMAIKNITDMMRGQPQDTIELLVQLHAYNNMALRYQVTPQGLVFIDEVMLTGNGQQDMIDGARWGFSNTTADHTMFIISNHGYGILDPVWNATTQQYEIKHDAPSASCSVKRSASAHYHTNHKGYVFNNVTHTYVTNAELITALDTITHSILPTTPIDIIAFDTCMGAMFEVAYQIAPFARYLVGNQTCSLMDGFDYQGVVSVLNKERNTPSDVAAGMVRAFDAYYTRNDPSGVYTHTALDLSLVEQMRVVLDTIIEQAIALPNAQALLSDVRNEAPRFCMWPMYTDIVEFFNILGRKLSTWPQSDQTRSVIHAIQQLSDTNNRMIVARCGGFSTSDLAHGSAIYCPYNHVDSSYRQTVFAHACQWITLLDLVCPNVTMATDTPGWFVS
jgi:hypothetical protein